MKPSETGESAVVEKQGISPGQLVIYSPYPEHIYPRHGHYISKFNDSFMEYEDELCEISVGTIAMFVKIHPKSFAEEDMWLMIVLIGDRLVSALNDVFTPYVAPEENDGI